MTIFQSKLNWIWFIFTKIEFNPFLYRPVLFDANNAPSKLTSPAPWNRIVWSESLVFVNLSDANKPATATEAVPWISSLNTTYWSRYFSKNRKALLLPKSSNWNNTRETHRIVNCFRFPSSNTGYLSFKKKKKSPTRPRGDSSVRVVRRTWISVFWPNRLTTASINSSSKSSYSWPVTRFWRKPMYSGSSRMLCARKKLQYRDEFPPIMCITRLRFFSSLFFPVTPSYYMPAPVYSFRHLL